MKKILLIALLSIFSQYSQAQSQFSLNNLKDLSWMFGHWERTNDKAGKKTVEFWEILPSKELKGIGLTTNPDTIFYEDMLIKMVDNQLVLQVKQKLSNNPTNFKITQLNSEGFICENPENDFPKRIHYFKTAQGMDATISNPGQAVSFKFIRSTKK